MSTQNTEARFEAATMAPPSYLGTIQGCPLLWDDQRHQPWWPEGEPTDVRYEADGSMTMEPQCDVHQAWWAGLGKPLDCGHRVAYPGYYLSWLAEQRDECLACATNRR